MVTQPLTVHNSTSSTVHVEVTCGFFRGKELIFMGGNQMTEDIPRHSDFHIEAGIFKKAAVKFPAVDHANCYVGNVWTLPK
jgi:hypothetical protein